MFDACCAGQTNYITRYTLDACLQSYGANPKRPGVRGFDPDSERRLGLGFGLVLG
ncbi:hypothetical protein DPMN_016807, partial [Dreissena polymorpha]